MKTLVPAALLLLVLSASTARSADRLPTGKAGQIAEAWITSSVVFRRAADDLPAGQSFAIAQVRSIPAQGPVQAYAVTLRPGGYVIVAADRRLTPVIAFSTEGTLDLSDDPDNAFRALLLADLSGSREVLAGDAASPALREALATNQARWYRLERMADGPGGPQPLDFYGTNVITEPMLQTRWSQWRHYNDRCPPDPQPGPGYDGKAPVGCIATAGGQIMNYHTWPRHGWGGHSFTDANGSNLVTGQHTAVFSRPIDWSNMQTSYNAYASEPQAAVDAVSGLMYNLGTAVEMDHGSFSNTGSLASSETLRQGLATYYHYEPGHATNRPPDTVLFDNTVRDEINSGRPVLIDTTSHSLVGDGYAHEDAGHYFHLNYGWGGQNDGWYQFSSVYLGPVANAVTGIRPRFMPLGTNDVTQVSATGSYPVGWTFPKTRRPEVAYYRLHEGRYSGSSNVLYAGGSLEGWRNSGRWSTNATGYGGTGACFYCASGEIGNHSLVTRDPIVPRTGSSLSFQYQARLYDDHFFVGISTNAGRTWNRVLDKTRSGPVPAWSGTHVDLSPYADRPTYVRFGSSLQSGKSYYPDSGAWVDNVAFSNNSHLGWRTIRDNIASNVFTEPVTGRVDGTYYYAAQAYNGATWGEQSPAWSVHVALDPTLDVDGDRIPNGWETRYYGSATGAVAYLDTDGDGRDARSEWWTGTHPRDPDSVFRVTDSRTTPTGQHLTWPAVSGRTYNVWQTTDLRGSGFNTLVATGVLANASQHTHFVRYATWSSNAYYRVGAVRK